MSFGKALGGIFMSFLNEYKRLDNLCKDLFGSNTGITTYIQNLEQFRYSYYEPEYKKLKKYRYIRNQIVHENNIDESDVCDEFDIEWIQDFYRRILEQSDPLALERKRTQRKEVPRTKIPKPCTYSSTKYTYKKKRAMSPIFTSVTVFLIVYILYYLLTAVR